MTNQTCREIIKSHVYGLNDEEIATCYKISQTTVKNIIRDFSKEIEELKKHYAKMEGKTNG